MDRRSFSRAVSAGGLLVALAGCAPQPEKKWRIGFLRRGDAPIPPEFWQAMAEFGWVEGRNVEIVTRVAENRPQVVALSVELVTAKVDLILVFGIGPTLAAKAASTTIPIVFSVGVDPAENGLVSSLARPGGNLTGFAIQPYGDKLLEILKEVLTHAPLVAYPIYEDVNPAIERAAGTLGMRVLGIQMASVDLATDVDPFYAAARKAGAGAIMVPEHPAIKSQLGRFAIEATAHGLPAIGYAPLFAEAGGLIAYGPNRAGEFKSVAGMVNKIFRGARPTDLPIELPTKFDLVINLPTAKALAITMPRLVMLRATKVIA